MRLHKGRMEDFSLMVERRFCISKGVGSSPTSLACSISS